MRTPLHGWGRYPVVEAQVAADEDLESATREAVLSRGMGRAYGDSALPPAGSAGSVAITTRADRVLSFDAETGVLRAEAGLTLTELAQLYLPRGWFTPVSPGTRYVTLGGMVAADIHGKNHHVHGTFGNFVRSLRMRVPDGRILEVSRGSEPELFAATLGGMGLTGHILEVEVQLASVASPYIREHSQRLDTFDAVFDALEEASASSSMTVAWVDTSQTGRHAGRGIVSQGEWAEPDEVPTPAPSAIEGVPIPFLLPSGLVNAASLKVLNTLWFYRHPARPRTHVVHPSAFFWPLDLAREWNRGYGRRGFTQYQCVMPRDKEVYRRFLQLFRERGGRSFVTVLKDCGPEGEGMLSFPQAGTTMALDIPISSVARTARLVAELNAYVLDHGGRVYLAKDAFTTAEEFRRMYPRHAEFEALRDAWDPQRRLVSAQSVRLMGDPTGSESTPPATTAPPPRP
ncbi:MAG: FAD-binding oxidoreductase [Myxococcales bacterium]|nr:FAD-binding oxidoreductase [Myxococcales bacterium]